MSKMLTTSAKEVLSWMLQSAPGRPVGSGHAADPCVQVDEWDLPRDGVPAWPTLPLGSALPIAGLLHISSTVAEGLAHLPQWTALSTSWPVLQACFGGQALVTAFVSVASVTLLERLARQHSGSLPAMCIEHSGAQLRSALKRSGACRSS